MTLTQIASILPQGETQFFDNNGVPLAGGSVYFYIPNTTTPKNTWQDPYGSVLNANPVVLDGGGRATIYGEGQYTMSVFDSLSNLIYTALTQDLLALFNLPATTRVALSTNTSYYVSTTGSDSTGNGTSGSPWATINHALNYIATLIDLRGFTATVNVADGTYTTPTVVQGTFVGQGIVQLVGDTATPANCILHTTSADCINVSQGAILYVEGFKLQTTTSGDCLHALDGGQIYVNGNMNYAACADSHIRSDGPGSLIDITSNYTISGSATNYHMSSDGGGSSIVANGLTITLTGTPAFIAFANANGDSRIDAVGNTYTGAATGSYFNVSANAFIKTGTNTLTYFPGNAAGTQTTGGVYNTLASVQLQAVQSTAKNLAVSWSSDTQVGITADSIALTNSSNAAFFALAVNATLATGTSGANGLDTGTLAASTWYYIFLIYNSNTNTVSSLMSLSATAPTLPSGYAYFALVSACRTDSSSNLIGFKQFGTKYQYTLGNNLSGMPVLASGSNGSTGGSGVWSASSVSAAVPPIASEIIVLLYMSNPGNGNFCSVAPNTNYAQTPSVNGGSSGGVYGTIAPPASIANESNTQDASVLAQMVLESTNVYYSSTTANAGLNCFGFVLNL